MFITHRSGSRFISCSDFGKIVALFVAMSDNSVESSSSLENGSDFNVVIEGSRPWGFTLQGGVDFRSPLVVGKVSHVAMIIDGFAIIFWNCFSILFTI